MNINLARLTTKNLATLAQRVINASQQGNYTLVQAHTLFNALADSYQNYDAVYTKLTYSGRGKAVNAAHKARVLAFNNLKNFLNAYRKLPLLNNYGQANTLFLVFKRFGLNISGFSYSKLSAVLKKLIEALEKPENRAAVANLNLTDVVQDLISKHTNFELLFAEQAEANAELRNMGNATVIRKDLERVLRSYLNMITALKDLPEWDKLYLELNEIVKAAKNSTLAAGNEDKIDVVK